MKIEHLHKLYLNASGVCTDTRKITHNCMFFALKGDNFNGNKFALEALQKGAAYAIVDENVDHSNVRLIQVKNVLETLQHLASFHRKQLNIPVLALTGSNGKTTTKELIREVLLKKFRVIATVGNLNNHIGVPLTLLSFDGQTELGIVEMGANHQGEIRDLCNIALPDYGLITNFGKAHLEGFGGIEGVIKGKSEMYEHLIENRKMIFYNSCDQVQKEKLFSYERTYSYGHCEATNYPTRLVSNEPYVSFRTREMTINSQLSGTYNYNNLALAAAIGHYFKVEDHDIKQALEAYLPSNNRSQVIRKGAKEILLDAYNANPSSMEAALKHFASTASESSKTVILGDMFELGEAATEEHQKIAILCSELGLDHVILVGKNFTGCKTHYPQIREFNDLTSYIKEHPINSDHILIKGSRGMALERILEFI